MKETTPREMRKATIELLEMMDSFDNRIKKFDAVGIAEAKTKIQLAQIIRNNLNNMLSMFDLLDEDFNEYREEAEALKQMQ